MKRFKLIPPFLTLLSGAVVSIVMFICGCETIELLLWLLGVMILFYIAGCVIQNRLTYFVVQIEEQEAAEEAERLKKETEEITDTEEDNAETEK